jgi:hypothetical protein
MIVELGSLATNAGDDDATVHGSLGASARRAIAGENLASCNGVRNGAAFKGCRTADDAVIVRILGVVRSADSVVVDVGVQWSGPQPTGDYGWRSGGEHLNVVLPVRGDSVGTARVRLMPRFTLPPGTALPGKGRGGRGPGGRD